MNKEVSIVIPTKNEGDVLANCLNPIDQLDYPKDKIEVIIVDGHSQDNTVETAKKYGCKVVYEDVGTRGGACNIGVKNAKGEYIAFTDADCVIQKDWLKNLIKQFNAEKIASVGGPNITPEDDTEFAKCVGAVLSFLSKPGSRYGLDAKEVIETFHNSGCNAAYRKDVIEEAGGFNEKLVTCEDEELDYRIRGKGYKILYTPDATVYHYRRPTWKRFYKQAYKYAIGRMQAIKLHHKMGRWFHYTPPISIFIVVLLFALAFLDPIFMKIALLFLLFGGFCISLMSLYLISTTKMKHFFTFLGLVIIWFFGYGFGMFRGLWK
jgi:cellulose synthase/poly-beta-1,6-N-acetylglucosamine synthase-like glycosyltransferase